MSATTPRPGGTIHALVVDDEPLARRSLSLLLAADPEVAVVGECETGADAAEVLRHHPVDLLFLDVQMPRMDGFELLRALGADRRAAVIFVTAHDHYALAAFEVHAFDYLLKPFDDARFARVLARAKEHVRSGRVLALAQQLAGLAGGSTPRAAVSASPPPARWLERILLKENGRVTFLPVEQVDWVEAEDCYVQLHAAGRAHLLRQSLRELEAQLDPRYFLRIHRSTLVNVRRVRELQPLFHGEYWVVMQDGARLKLSRTYRARLDALLAGR